MAAQTTHVLRVDGNTLLKNRNRKLLKSDSERPPRPTILKRSCMKTKMIIPSSIECTSIERVPGKLPQSKPSPFRHQILIKTPPLMTVWNNEKQRDSEKAISSTEEQEDVSPDAVTPPSATPGVRPKVKETPFRLGFRQSLRITETQSLHNSPKTGCLSDDSDLPQNPQSDDSNDSDVILKHMEEKSNSNDNTNDASKDELQMKFLLNELNSLQDPTFKDQFLKVSLKTIRLYRFFLNSGFKPSDLGIPDS